MVLYLLGVKPAEISINIPREGSEQETKKTKGEKNQILLVVDPAAHIAHAMQTTRARALSPLSE